MKKKLKLIRKAAEHIAAVAEANGVPVNDVIPLVQGMAVNVLHEIFKRKRKKH